MPDADDTAQGLYALRLLGISKPYEPLIQQYETTDHFLTYKLERNPSFSANCNVLNALLYSADVTNYSSQVLKCATFICDSWWRSNTPLLDKWVSSCGIN
jgi:hypothetical protein